MYQAIYFACASTCARPPSLKQMLTKPYTESVVIYGLSPIFMGCSLLRDVAGQPAFPRTKYVAHVGRA